MPRLAIYARDDNIVCEVELRRGEQPVVHVHHHYHTGTGGQQFAAIMEELERMASFMEEARQRALKTQDAVAANEQLLRDMSTRLREALDDDDPEKAKEILDMMDANAANLARAAQENTVPPRTPPPASEPIPEEPAPAPETPPA